MNKKKSIMCSNSRWAFYVYVFFLVYLLAAFITFDFRHPRATRWERVTHIVDQLTFQEVKELQFDK